MKPSLMLVFIFVAILLQGALATAATDVYFDPQIPSQVEAGKDYTINVKINTNEELTGYEFDVVYNQAVLTVVSYADGTFFDPCSNMMECVEVSAEDVGKITFGGIKVNAEPETGEGILGTITFHVESTGVPGVSLGNIILLDEEMRDISTSSEPNPYNPPNDPTSDGGSSGSSGGYATCTPNWNCTEWSVCSGGIQYRTCKDTKKCKVDKSEDQPCGGSAYHGNYSGGEGYVAQSSGSGACSEGTRVCSSDGVVECRNSRLIKVETCQYGCERGICLDKEGKPTSTTGQIILDPAIAIYGTFIVVIVVFGALIAFYGLK